MLLTMRNGAQVEIRPIRPDDEQRIIKFHKGLSERSVYMRYFKSLSLGCGLRMRAWLRSVLLIPKARLSVLPLSPAPPSGDPKILAVARLSGLSDPGKAELAVLVLDESHGFGLGSGVLRRLIQAARDRRITQIEAKMLRDHTAIQRVLKNVGFRFRLSDPRFVRAVLNL
jgi:acetyltransferase